MGLPKNLTDKVERILAVQELVEQGKKPYAISKELGIEIEGVYRNIKYAEELAVVNLTSKEISEKRRELYLEAYDMASKAKKAFESALEEGQSIAAKRYFDAWLDATKLRSKLYGTIIENPNQYIQINLEQNKEAENDVPSILSKEVRKELSEKIKQEHEAKMRKTYEMDRDQRGEFSLCGTTTASG